MLPTAQVEKDAPTPSQAILESALQKRQGLAVFFHPLFWGDGATTQGLEEQNLSDR